jgi:GlpG protein
MRLIATLNDQQKAFQLASYLTHFGIENKLDVITNTDWGSHEYGNATCQIWVIDEDQIDASLKITSEFLENPEHPKFNLSQNALPDNNPEGTIVITPPPIKAHQSSMGPLTLKLIIICCLLLMFSTLTSPLVVKAPPQVVPALSSSVNKELLIDRPFAFHYIDELITLYGPGALEHPETLPEEGKKLLNDYYSTPWWHGFYEKIVHRLQDPTKKITVDAPLFEKIREGEIWRIITPILLHSDLFHLFFNMIWLAVLGKQLEQRLRKARYLLFILIVGIVSNIAQYLMSGPNFLGFSGVLCGMIAFIWMRQRHAAWEGYQLEKGTIGFIAFFILFMFSIQMVFFFLEISKKSTLSVGIANTAHLTGALVGYLLAKMNFFAWKGN